MMVYFFFVFINAAGAVGGGTDLSLLCTNVDALVLGAAKKIGIFQSTPMKNIFGAPATFNQNSNGLAQLRQNTQLSFGFGTDAVDSNATFNIHDFGQLNQNNFAPNQFFVANARLR